MTEITVPAGNTADVAAIQAVIDARWPQNIEKPAFVTVEQDEWDIVLGPALTLEMSNGAEFAMEHLDPEDPLSKWEEFRGDWLVYTQGNDALSDVIVAVVAEAFVLIHAGRETTQP